MYNLEELHRLVYNINCCIAIFNDIHDSHSDIIHSVHIIGHNS